jgi:hypothetical protein
MKLERSIRTFYEAVKVKLGIIRERETVYGIGEI